MEFLSTVLIAFALAMDAFSVSVTAGVQTRHVRLSQAVSIALYFGIFQWLMTYAGWYAGTWFADMIVSFDHWVALALLVAIGGKMIYGAFFETEEHAIAWKHHVLLLLAVATSIDALGVGLSYSFIDSPIAVAAFTIGVVAAMCSYIGVYVGKHLHAVLGKKMEVIGGIILLLIGVNILVNHGVFS